MVSSDLPQEARRRRDARRVTRIFLKFMLCYYLSDSILSVVLCTLVRRFILSESCVYIVNKMKMKCKCAESEGEFAIFVAGVAGQTNLSCPRELPTFCAIEKNDLAPWLNSDK
jgi:hypothetical protein